MNRVAGLMNLLRKLAVCAAVLFGLLGASASRADDNVIRFGVPDVGYPPYVMTTSGGSYGSIGDIFVEISHAIGFKVEVISLPEKRLRLYFESGKLNAIAGALEWEPDTSGYLWTKGVIQVSDNLVMLEEKNIDTASIEVPQGKSVTLKRGYQYPSLEKSIKSGLSTTHSAAMFNGKLTELKMDGR